MGLWQLGYDGLLHWWVYSPTWGPTIPLHPHASAQPWPGPSCTYCTGARVEEPPWP